MRAWRHVGQRHAREDRPYREGNRSFDRKPGDARDAGPDDLLLPVFKDNIAYRWIGSTNMVAELIHNSTGDVRRKELVFTLHRQQ